MTTQTSNSPGERLSRFFDAAGVIAVSLRSQSSPEGPSPMERVGKALGKTALMLTAVVGAGAYGAIQHRMSDSFHEVPLDQAILEVAASASADIFPTAMAELKQRSAAGETAPATPDHRIAVTETAITWFETEGIMTPGVQDALARWGIYADADHFHIEELPAITEELLPSPWGLKSLIETVALQGDMTAKEAAESIDRDLRTFMISSDLCSAGRDVDCIARVTNIANGDVVLEMNARTGAFGVRPQLLAEEDIPEGMRL